MRLLYLDEAGTDRVKAPHLCVAGVLIHGDRDWPEIDRRLSALVEKYIPETDRDGFIFHSTDLYHGARYFDRRKPEWADREVRHGIMEEMAAIIGDLEIPVVFGHYDKEIFGEDMDLPVMAVAERESLIHNVAAMDCLTRADKWLAAFAPNELATVIHEDGTPAKGMIRRCVRALRSPRAVAESGLSEEAKRQYGIPLKRIIDAVNFVGKEDARPLQLADLCAFAFGRLLKKKPIPPDVLPPLVKQLGWMKEVGLPSSPSEEGGM